MGSALVTMHRGRIVDETVKAVVNHTDGPRLQVDFGNDETALIYVDLDVVANREIIYISFGFVVFGWLFLRFHSFRASSS